MHRLLLHYIFWTLSFTQGLINLLGISTALYKVGIPIVILILTLITLAKGKIILKFHGYMILLISVSCLSIINTNVSLFSLMYFLIYLIQYYIYFLIVINEKNIIFIRKIFNFIVILFLIQIPAVLIKFMIIGPSEKGAIGTVSLDAGSISTILPLLAICFCLSYYFFDRKKKYLLLIALFILFSIIGAKRAIGLFVPILIIIMYLILNYKNSSLNMSSIFKNVFIVFLISFVGLYITVRFNVNMNPDNEFGGRFDLIYAISYASDYIDTSDEDFQEMQRIEATAYFMNYLLNKSFGEFLFGEGAGKLVESKYTGGSNNLMLEHYGVRYGGRMTSIWMYLQIGIIGLILYNIFIFQFFWYVWKNYSHHPFYLFTLSLYVVFLLDFFTYSNEFYRQPYLMGIFMASSALIYLDNKLDKQIIKKMT